MNPQDSTDIKGMKAIKTAVSRIGDLQVGLQQSLRRRSEAVDLVSTQVDRISQHALISLLQRITPEYGIIAEENSFAHQVSCQRIWCIDPLDGTANYAVGLPLWCISVCLLEDYIPIWAVVHVPPCGDTYHAEKGKGAFLNDRRLSTEESPACSVLFSFPVEKYPDSNTIIRRLAQLGAIAGQVGDIRTFNATALEFCYIASGRLGGFFVEQTARIWDICGGMLILQEAGGKVSTPDGGDLLLSSDIAKRYSVFAGTQSVHNSLLRIVSSRGLDSTDIHSSMERL